MRIYGGEEELSTATARTLVAYAQDAPYHPTPKFVCPARPAPGVGADYRGVARTPLPVIVNDAEEAVLADAEDHSVIYRHPGTFYLLESLFY